MTTTVQYSNGSRRTFKAASTAANEIDRHEGAVIFTDGSDDVAEIVDADADAEEAEKARVAAEEEAIAEAARVREEDARAAEDAKQAEAAAAQQQQQVDPVTGLPTT